MMSYRTEYDNWPWRGHREQGREDARYGRKDRDLYDRYDGEHKRAYVEEFDRETRRIEDQRRERREEEEREERHAAEAARRRREEKEYERQLQEEQMQREYEMDLEEHPAEEPPEEA